MRNVIGIRRETVDDTERRAPLTPTQVGRFIEAYGIRVIVEPSQLRIFPETEYERVGAEISSDLSECNVVFGVKEIPVTDIHPERVFCYFSHTIKAQRYNMPMLGHILEHRATLLDYELVTNAEGKRLIFFGDFAGFAGMIDSLWALGQRLDYEGIANPFTMIEPAWRYDSLARAIGAVSHVGKQIEAEGLPDTLVPFVCAFTGDGKVAQGAQRIFNFLPTVEVAPDELPALFEAEERSNRVVYRVGFAKPDLYEHKTKTAALDPKDLDKNPGAYQSAFRHYLKYFTMVINGIYWEPCFPRLITKDFIRDFYADNENPRLRVVGDVTCDIEGSIEFTVKSTTSKHPIFVYDPVSGEARDGWEGQGPVVLAVDKLPAELPREASISFGDGLSPFIRSLAAADFTRPIEDLEIPNEFKRAVIAHHGYLTDNFRYLNNYLL